MDDRFDDAMLARMILQRISTARRVPGSGPFQRGYQAGLDLAANLINTMLDQKEQQIENSDQLKW
jgi:hypothetical protein